MSYFVTSSVDTSWPFPEYKAEWKFGCTIERSKYLRLTSVNPISVLWTNVVFVISLTVVQTKPRDSEVKVTTTLIRVYLRTCLRPNAMSFPYILNLRVLKYRSSLVRSRNRVSIFSGGGSSNEQHLYWDSFPTHPLLIRERTNRVGRSTHPFSHCIPPLKGLWLVVGSTFQSLFICKREHSVTPY